MPTKAQRQFPGATAYRDRHGRRRWRYRSKGFTAELGTEYGSEEFVLRYEAALQGERTRAGVGARRTRPGTIDALCVSYLRSPGFRRLGPGSRRRETNEIARIRDRVGGALVRDFERRHVLHLMGERADTPASANNLRRMLRKLFAHGIDIEMIRANPVRDVPAYSTAAGGFHTWTEAEIARFYEVHRPGTLAHLAVTLLLYTGASRVDAVRLGWANIRGARLVYRRRKTEGKVDVEIDIPIHAALAEALQLAPKGAETFLATRTGAQRSPAGFGNAMRAWCDEAGLEQCTAHGLRKAIARRLAEAGASAHEIMSVTGHTTLSEAERYTRDAVRRTMADRALARLAEAQQTVTNLEKGSPDGPRKGLKRLT